MTPSQSNLFYNSLHIPLIYNRRLNRAYDLAGWMGVKYEVFQSSLEFNSEAYIARERFDGPGYLGYLFFMIYDMVVIYETFKYLFGRHRDKVLDAVRRVRLKKHHINKLIANTVTGYEVKFMRRMGFNYRKFLSSVSTLRFNKPIDIAYYRSEFRRLRAKLLNEKFRYSFEVEDFIPILNSLISFGIGLSLLYRVVVLEFILFTKYLSREVNDLHRLYEEGLDGYSIFIKLARKMEMDYLYENSLFHHRYLVTVVKTEIEVVDEKGWIRGIFRGISCIYPYATSIMANGNRSEAKEFLKPICLLCRSLITKYIVWNGYRAEVDIHIVRSNSCEIQFKVVERESEKYGEERA